MKCTKSLLFTALAATLLLSSCSGVPKGTGGGGGGGSTAKVSFVLVSDTPPTNLGLVSFKVVPTAITLTPTSGTPTTSSINGGNGYSFDLVRLQSDSAFLGTAAAVPTGTYSSIAVTFSSAQVAFFNGTGAAITNLNPQCPANSVCLVTFGGPFTATTTSSPSVTANTGLAIDVNLATAISVTAGSLTVNPGATGAVSAVPLPRTSSNLASGQLDLIEDVTGVVTLGGSGITINAATAINHPSIAATVTSSTVLDEDPTLSLCTSPTAGSISSCVSSNQAASMDAILNADGTFTAQEVEPLLATLKDTVEGTIVSINSGNQTQFSMVVTDIIPAATNSLVGSLGVGSPLTVNLAVGPTFFVDSKGLPIANSFPTSYGTFTQSTNTTGLHLGQTVAVHVPAFVAANGTTAAIANNVDTVTLRWSRFTSTPTGVSTNAIFNVTSLPGYFGFTPASVFQVQIFLGTQGTEGVTNLDGIANGNAPGATPLAVRALFIETPGNTLSPAFFAAKVRQH